MADEIDGTCPECGGRTIEFRGHGTSMQYRVCSRYTEPGHKSLEEVRREIVVVRTAVRPNGRFA